jgi:hypothetical protein
MLQKIKFILAIAICIFCSNAWSQKITNDKLTSFWDSPKNGANIFNRQVHQEDIKAAKSYGVAFIRLS